MNALYLETKSGPGALVRGDLPRPQPRTGEVLVQVHATAVTPTEFDWFPTFHTPAGAPRVFPIVLGHEFAGAVAALGPDTTGFSVGDEVFGLNDWFSNGAFAEFCLAPAAALAPRPASLTPTEAAVVPISALTAWQALIGRGKIQRGDRVLIHGASGAVGGFAVQLAHQRGAHVIATASAGNLDFVRSLGAQEAIDYRQTRFEDVADEIDLVFDPVGGDTLDRSWSVLRHGGRLVTIATSSGASKDPRVHDAFMLVEANAAQLRDLAAQLDAASLKAHVAATYSLADAPAAFARARAGGLRGKIALRVAG